MPSNKTCSISSSARASVSPKLLLVASGHRKNIAMQNLKTEPVMQEFTTPQMCIDERNQEFKSLVQDVAERLGQDDVTAFVFQCDLPLTFRTSMRQPTGLDLLMQLERDGLFSPGKIAPLADLLMKIHRCDLVTHYIESYLQRYPGQH